MRRPCGKSTLVHSLSDKRLLVTSGTGAYKIDVEAGMLPGFTIGHALDSATTVPVSWYDQASNLVYWDCPGFMDSRGEGQEIVNAFAINQLFTPPNRMKILLAIQESDFEAARGMEILKRFDKITKLIPNQEQLKQGLSIIVTKKLDARFTVQQKLQGLLEHARQTQEAQQFSKVIDLLQFMTTNADTRIFEFPAPSSAGVLATFPDKGRLIQNLKVRALQNPEHAFSFDPNVQLLLLETMQAYADVPHFLYDLEKVIQVDYRSKELEELKEWGNFVVSLLREAGTIETPQNLTAILRSKLPRHAQRIDVFAQIINLIENSQRYISLAQKVQQGCVADIQVPSIPGIIVPMLNEIQSELNQLIKTKEFLVQQERAMQALKSTLDKQVQEGKQTREKADAEIRNKTKEVENAINRSKQDCDALQRQIADNRRNADRERESALSEQRRDYDRRISDLQSRLSNADQSSLISRLRDRIEELENHIRNNRGGGGQFVMTPYGLMRVG